MSLYLMPEFIGCEFEYRKNETIEWQSVGKLCGYKLSSESNCIYLYFYVDKTGEIQKAGGDYDLHNFRVHLNSRKKVEEALKIFPKKIQEISRAELLDIND